MIGLNYKIQFSFDKWTNIHESFFWERVHEHLTSSTTLQNNGCKYNICQVKENNDSSKYIDVKSSDVFVKNLGSVIFDQLMELLD